VIDDVRRLGGFGIAAHPDSPKAELQWREWNAPFDGIELLNPDTTWRVWAQQAARASNAPSDVKWRARRTLALSLLDYPVRPAETIASLLHVESPLKAVRQWTTIAARRRLVAIAGIDAHAKLALRGDPGDAGFALPLPGYEPSFRVMSVHVATERPLSGNAAADANALCAGHPQRAPLCRGRRHRHAAVVRIQRLQRAWHRARRRRTGGRRAAHVAREKQRATGLHDLSSGAGPRCWAMSITNRSSRSTHLRIRRSTGWRSDPAVRNPIAWLRSNAIYVRGSAPPPAPPARPAATDTVAIFDGKFGDRMARRARHLVGRCRRAGDDGRGARNPVPLRARRRRSHRSVCGARLRHPAHWVRRRSRHVYRARREADADLGSAARGDGVVDRWQRSVYVDTFDRERTVFFDDCLPVGTTHTDRAPLPHVRSVMFVVDTTNSKPGASGRLWIKKAALQR
jgi:hypothetical protein